MINFLDTVPEADQLVGGGAVRARIARRGAVPTAGVGATARSAATMREPIGPARAAEIPWLSQRTTRSTGTVACRGIRGATTVETNTAEDILEATTDLLDALIRLNEIAPEDVVSAIFTTTPELTATFPALAARESGWTEVPLLCAHEMNVPGCAARRRAHPAPRQHRRARRPRFATSICARRARCGRSGRTTTRSCRQILGRVDRDGRNEGIDPRDRSHRMAGQEETR